MNLISGTIFPARIWNARDKERKRGFWFSSSECVCVGLVAPVFDERQKLPGISCFPRERDHTPIKSCIIVRPVIHTIKTILSLKIPRHAAQRHHKLPPSDTSSSNSANVQRIDQRWGTPTSPTTITFTRGISIPRIPLCNEDDDDDFVPASVSTRAVLLVVETRNK